MAPDCHLSSFLLLLLLLLMLLLLLLLLLHCFSPPAMSCPPYGVPYPEPTNAPRLHHNV